MPKHEAILRKIRSREEAGLQVAQWKNQGKKIVFTNGCFDLLHPGHIDYLSKAADLGDLLVIGLNTDTSVQRLKGPHRPITDQYSRSVLMAALSFVDLVTLFDEDTPYELIQLISPDVLVKGGDYTPETIVGADWVTSRGGQVVVLPFLPGFSTTAIEEKIYRTRTSRD